MRRTATLMAALAVAFAAPAAPVRTATEGFVTNKIAAATTNLNARPVIIPSTSAGRGVTFTDQYGENQNVAVEIGEGATAAVTTNALEAAPDNKVVRSTGVAVGGHAEVRNDADPLKVQGVAIGWHAQVSAINGVAIGSGAQHTNETDQTSGATVASAPKAIAVGYGAKSAANDAVQIGEGVNSEPGTLKYRDVTIVKNGRVQGGVDEAELLADGFAKLSIVEETNGVKRVTIENDDCTFRVVTDTNRADGVALTMGDAEIYGTAAVDRRLAADTTLTPIYSNTPTFSAWVCSPEGTSISWNSDDNRWEFSYFGDGFDSTVTDRLAVEAVSAPGITPILTATRTRTDIIGYTLGSQTDKPLQPKGDYASVGDIPPVVTNIVKGLSLGGIWDSGLEVWWTPRMRNGSLTYEATTNVNLNAEN